MRCADGCTFVGHHCFSRLYPDIVLKPDFCINCGEPRARKNMKTALIECETKEELIDAWLRRWVDMSGYCPKNQCCGIVDVGGSVHDMTCITCGQPVMRDENNHTQLAACPECKLGHVDGVLMHAPTCKRIGLLVGIHCNDTSVTRRVDIQTYIWIESDGKHEWRRAVLERVPLGGIVCHPELGEDEVLCRRDDGTRCIVPAHKLEKVAQQ
jgi:DNA-directed RNA polymerase subunit RPC12/RpoP